MFTTGEIGFSNRRERRVWKVVNGCRKTNLYSGEGMFRPIRLFP